ncbi:MAG: hypothetical protein HYZ34_10165 [Ignavibacteriae bacterium]|nr:hypothetical protein [Ignavibacteriota bacterium]
MISQEQFYHQHEHPDSKSKERMWKAIRSQIRQPGASLLYIESKRSFIYGIAAALLLYFTSVGVYITIGQAIESGKPQEVRFNEAYQSAIQDFEKVLPQLTNGMFANEKERDYVRVRKEQLAKIDAAIMSFLSERGKGDVSPLAQSRLRNLYSMKLQVLQQLINQGEIEL